MSKEKWNNVFRWVGVLPLSVASMYVASFINKILVGFELNYIGIDDVDSFMYIVFEYFQSKIIGNIFILAIFVISGSILAPKHNKIVSLVLMVVGISVSSVSIFIVNFISFEYLENIPLIASVLGCISGYLYINDKYKTTS